jgi:hypothetical protein
MQDEVDVIEGNNRRKSLREVIEQRLQIAMYGDCFGNIEERPVLGARKNRALHSNPFGHYGGSLHRWTRLKAQAPRPPGGA